MAPDERVCAMKVSVEFDANGMLADAYGKYAQPQDQAGRLSRRSFPFEVSEIPASARALAVLFFDWDSVPVCGFPWIHWCCTVDLGQGATSFAMPDDASRTGLAGMVQGYNSAAKNEPDVAVGYVGPCPPDKDHVYSLRVYALDYVPQLEGPFWANEMIAATRGHMVGHTQVEIPSRA